jgi:DNA-binding response OmpR family regulator
MEPTCPVCGHILPDSTGAYINEEENVVILDKVSIRTTPKVRQILRVLIAKSPRTVSKGTLMDVLYGLESGDEEPEEKIIDVFVCRAKKDIKGSNYEILTIWGKGYLFRRKVLDGEEVRISC